MLLMTKQENKMMKLFDQKILSVIGEELLQKKETVAVAESVTAGLLQFAISNITDAAKFFQGGITAYNIGQKFKHLRVEPIHALEVNCVSEQVACEMALHVCRLFSSHWGVAVTGYASPVPESGNKLYAWFAIVSEGQVKASGKINAVKAKPAVVQQRYTETILKKLQTCLAGNS